ncbi:MAG: hypothetical protein ACPW60_01445 [Methylohalobius sp. ZOD2]|nr:hypothetical protein [Methylothermaceae bacterium]
MLHLRILALLLISLPQAFMPLLHAHVGEDGSPRIVHVPGWESYFQETDGSALKGNSLASDWQGVVVRSDGGIRRQSLACPPLVALPVEPIPDVVEPRLRPPRRGPPRIAAFDFTLSAYPRAPPA